VDKEIYGYLSLLLTVAAYAPYAWSTWKGTTRPHIFSWVIWTVLMVIATAGQFAGSAGPGWWATGLSAAACLIIALQAWRQGDKNITRSDWAVFIGALAAIPFWLITGNPLTAIIIVTVIDALSYAPTFRKSWHAPHEEMPLHYIISNLKHIASLFAMSAYTMTTVLYPMALLAMNTMLVAMIYWRRIKVNKDA
jgi:hypothetical protein